MDPDIVHVTKRTEALGSPNFVIEHGGRYYVAVAVLEYDPNARGITKEQRNGVDQIRQMFERAAKEAPLTGAELDPSWMASAGCMNTIPGPRPKHKN